MGRIRSGGGGGGAMSNENATPPWAVYERKPAACRHAPAPPEEWSEADVRREFMRSLNVQIKDLRAACDFCRDRPGLEPEFEFYSSVLAETNRALRDFCAAADAGNGWRAAWHAWQLGSWRAYKDTWAAPAHIRGQQVREGAKKAGQQKRGKRKGPEDAVLRSEVQMILAAEANNPNMSDTRACRHVAQRHGLSVETVLRRTRGHRRP